MIWYNLLLGLSSLLLINYGDSAAIIGIDYGTEFIKVASVQPGKAFDIVENENSQRKETNAIAWDRGIRLFGGPASSVAQRDPSSVIMRARDMLGVDKEAIKKLEDFGLNYQVLDDPETGGFKIKVNDDISIRPEEINGMILANIKRYASKFTGEDIVDCVITVPSFFDQSRREALLNSAEIAGLNVLTLIDENVAAAVQHGIYNEFTNSSHLMMIYNMGSATTKVTLLDFFGKAPKVGGKNAKLITAIQVLGKVSNDNLGGHTLNKVLVDIVVDRFEKKFGGEVSQPIRKNARAMSRIWTQCIKVKTVLSANTEIPISIEKLHDGKDLKVTITRKEFEEAAEEIFFKHVLTPVKKLLENTGKTVKDLSSLELIGGGIRVPKLKKILTGFFGEMELGNHLNGDESKAFGAVFAAANMSKTFRVRPVILSEITTESVSVSLEEIGNPTNENRWNKKAQIYSRDNALGQRKIVSINNITFVNDLSCKLTRKESDESSGTDVAYYQVKGVQEAVEKFGQYGKPKLSLTFLLSLNDTVGLQKAEAIFVEDIPAPPEEEEEKGEVVEEEEKKEEEKKEEEKKEETKEEEKKEDQKKKKEKKKIGPTKKMHKYTLKIIRTNDDVKIKPLGSKFIAEAKDLLAAWSKKEQEKEEHEAAKNSLESFIFSSRDKIRSSEEEVDEVLSEADKEKLFEDLEALEDWLDGEGSNVPIAEYNKRRDEVNKRVKAIMFRVDELDQRPASIRASNKLIATIKDQINNVWPDERPWISKAERQQVQITLATFEGWLAEAAAEQEKVSLKEEPVLTTSDILTHLEPVQDILELALKRGPPKPPPKPKTPKKEKDATKKSSTNQKTDDKKEEKTDDKKEEKADNGKEEKTEL